MSSSDPTHKQNIAAALDAAMQAKHAVDEVSIELAELRTMVGANAIAVRDTREKAFKKIAAAHDEIMRALTEILKRVGSSA